jgi:opacity protein-like surface antigen
MNRFLALAFCALSVLLPARDAWATAYFGGPYVGGYVGAQQLNVDNSFDYFDGSDSSSRRSFDDTTIFGGGFMGYNWQNPVSRWVVGIEGDIGYADYGNRNFNHSDNLHSTSNTAAIGLQGSLRGRMGYVVNNAMPYFTMGLALADGRDRTAEGYDCCNSFTHRQSDTLTGFTVGAGLEYAVPFMPGISMRGEYRYTNYGGNDVDGRSASVNDYLYRTHNVYETNSFLFGLGYRFH